MKSETMELKLDVRRPEEHLPLADGIKLSIPDPGRLEMDAKSFTVKDFDTDMPDDSWSDEELMDYAKHQAEQIQTLKRTVAIHVYRLGMALSFYRERHLDHGDWEGFLKNQGLSVPTAWRAVQLFKRAKSEAEVVDLGITEAYIHFKILQKAKKEKPEWSSPRPVKKRRQQPVPDSSLLLQEVKPKLAMRHLAPATINPFPKKHRSPRRTTIRSMPIRAPGKEDGEATASEKPTTPTTDLMAIKRGLELVERKLAVIDWTKEWAADHRKQIQEIILIAQRMEKALW